MKKQYFIFVLIFITLVCAPIKPFAQSSLPQTSESGINRFLTSADTLHQNRFWISTATGTAIYSGVSIGLWNAWYKGFDIGGFRFFDDSKEWLQVDKVGHFFSAYNMSRWVYRGAEWTGMKDNRAAWTGTLVGFGLMGTLETMDGFSKKWGFSMSDVAFNTGGCALFLGQQLAWQDQRIILKVSNGGYKYPDITVRDVSGQAEMKLADRGTELYGSTPWEVFLKDYNGQTNWLSVNPAAFLSCQKPQWLPAWLNLAVGYGATNLYGGFENSWESDGFTYKLGNEWRPYRQFYLSPDIDLTRIPTNKKWLRSMFYVLNFIKIPAPALELNRGGLKGHWIYW